MNKTIPIGCRSQHFYKKIGKNSVCMYCGSTIPMESTLDVIKPHLHTIHQLFLRTQALIDDADKTIKKYGTGTIKRNTR